ncbi:MAG: cutinase [Mycobacterium sp.]|nr:cutinase [Mycobacterium sp.]
MTTHMTQMPARRVRGILAAVCTGAIGVAGLMSLAPKAHAASSCSDVEVVFARGTAEPAGVGRVGQAFVDDLKSQLGGKTVSVYAVDYPASYDFLTAADGANAASAHVQATAATCPNTDIVLGGYSQGAAVVDFITAAPGPVFGFTNLMPSNIVDHVSAVAVFGNPSDRIGKPLTTFSSLYGAKTIDLCNGADPVCSNGDDRAAHSLYVEAGMASQAADFVAQHINGAVAPAPAQLASNVEPQ